jgi:hypothetical protein
MRLRLRQAKYVVPMMNGELEQAGLLSRLIRKVRPSPATPPNPSPALTHRAPSLRQVGTLEDFTRAAAALPRPIQVRPGLQMRGFWGRKSIDAVLLLTHSTPLNTTLCTV